MIFLAIKDVPLIFIHDTLSIVHFQHKVQAFACFSSNIVNPKPDWALLIRFPVSSSAISQMSKLFDFQSEIEEVMTRTKTN